MGVYCAILWKQERKGDDTINDNINKVEDPFRPKKTSDQKQKKLILFVIIGLVVLIGGFFGITKIQQKSQESAEKKAVYDAVKPIMESYGLKDFKVTGGFSSSIHCEDFEKLSDKQKFDCIQELDRIGSVTTKKGDRVNLLSFNVYVSKTGYYYRVATAQVVYLGNYKEAGLYYADGGSRRCVYQKDN